VWPWEIHVERLGDVPYRGVPLTDSDMTDMDYGITGHPLTTGATTTQPLICKQLNAAATDFRFVEGNPGHQQDRPESDCRPAGRPELLDGECKNFGWAG